MLMKGIRSHDPPPPSPHRLPTASTVRDEDMNPYESPTHCENQETSFWDTATGTVVLVAFFPVVWMYSWLGFVRDVAEKDGIADAVQAFIYCTLFACLVSGSWGLSIGIVLRLTQ
jgi:hypothetical protein